MIKRKKEAYLMIVRQRKDLLYPSLQSPSRVVRTQKFRLEEETRVGHQIALKLYF